jgi:hypothetical protein
MAALGGDDARERFCTEYGPHGAELAKHFANVRVAHRTTVPFTDGRAQVKDGEGTMSNDQYLSRERSTVIGPGEKAGSDKPDQLPGVYCTNSKYSFSLGRSKGEYAITDVSVHGVDKRLILPFPAAPYADWQRGLSYAAVGADAETNVIAYRDAEWQGKPVKELLTSYTYREPKTGKKTEIKCSYFFAPQDGWVCGGVRYYLEAAGKQTTWLDWVYVYSSNGSSPPSLKRMEKWTRDPSDPKGDKLKQTTEFSEYEVVAAVPDEEFRLTAFGFPEPVGVVWHKPIPRYIWFLVAAGGLGLCALVFRWLARRKPAPAAPTPSP